MATHLETIQWHVRPAGVVEGPNLYSELPVVSAVFTETEVLIVIKQLRSNRATGPDDIPAEYWQAVSETPTGIGFLTGLCNVCWNDESMPVDWHTAHVNALHKKGPVEDCDNYRPISLVCVFYKLFASLLLKRLKKAGAESRLTDTQFGFRSGRGTNDAIFFVRRSIELALAQRGGQIAMLALDWAKAFDSINVEALLIALKRFGLPPKILRVIGHIYSDRNFRVVDAGSTSTERRQLSGISQGCPLSPFLFVMLMTVVMEDAFRSLDAGAKTCVERGLLGTLLYADDTLLIGTTGTRVQELLTAVSSVGSRYGMQLHWSKFQLLAINGKYKLTAPDGSLIAAKEVMTYLGAAIFADGGIKSELSRKLGAAWAEFSKLAQRGYGNIRL